MIEGKKIRLSDEALLQHQNAIYQEYLLKSIQARLVETNSKWELNFGIAYAIADNKRLLSVEIEEHNCSMAKLRSM